MHSFAERSEEKRVETSRRTDGPDPAVGDTVAKAPHPPYAKLSTASFRITTFYSRTSQSTTGCTHSWRTSSRQSMGVDHAARAIVSNPRYKTPGIPLNSPRGSPIVTVFAWSGLLQRQLCLGPQNMRNLQKINPRCPRLNFRQKKKRKEKKEYLKSRKG